MNAVFAPDREHTGAREPTPSSQGDELKSTLALQPFRLQFISSAPDRGPSIVTEVEVQASDAPAAIVAAAKVAFPPERSDCASSTVKAARSLADGGAIAQGSTNDRDTIRGILPATWTPPERRFDRRLMKSKPTPKACVCHARASSRVRCVGVNRPRTVGPPLFPVWRSPHARKQPKSGRRQSHPARRRPRSERPERRLSYAARNCRRTLQRRVPLPRRTCAIGSFRQGPLGGDQCRN
jgi:hypothetical protein